MKRTCLQLTALLGFAVLLLGSGPALAQTAPSLGTAGSFAVLGGSTVTNSGATVITGDLGVSPGSAITGFPPGVVVGGTIHAADATALAAQNAVTTAYDALAAEPCTQDLTGQDLGGLTLTPGVYCFSSSAQLTGTLTLNAQGNSSAVFIFKIGSTLTTASGSTVSIINGTISSLCNVFWQVGSSATLGTTSAFTGNILALTSITLTTGTTVTGRALARNGAVTLDSNTVSASACSTSVPPPGCPAVSFSPAALPSGTIGVAYTQTLTGSGGAAPYTFTTVAGALPAGLTLTTGGSLAGTPTTAGSSEVTIRVTDANGCFADRGFTIAITTAVPTLPQAFVALLGIGLTGVGYYRLRRRARRQL
jgi:type VI secretion system secreted protein VgrG